MDASCSIFFFTSDGYSDCWPPFFKLFKKYWPECDAPIVMSTEYKEYSYPGLAIIPAKVSSQHNVSPEKQPAWGQRMLWGLEKVQTELVILLQEDFFLEGDVNQNIIDDIVSYMKSHQDIRCFHFTPIKAKPSKPSNIPNVYEISHNTSYRVSAQPAIWRTEELKTLIKENYTPWQFEVIGSKISGGQKKKYLMYDNNYVKLNPIYPYIATGILKGKWNQDVIPLFKENDIQIDYSIRGFYKRESFIHQTVNALKWRLKLLWHLIKFN